jgi:hypothetical protein
MSMEKYGGKIPTGETSDSPPDLTDILTSSHLVAKQENMGRK